METALIVAAILAALAGAFSLHDAFLGVGFIAIGCLLAIIARMVQAEAHDRARGSMAQRASRMAGSSHMSRGAV